MNEPIRCPTNSITSLTERSQKSPYRPSRRNEATVRHTLNPIRLERTHTPGRAPPTVRKGTKPLHLDHASATNQQERTQRPPHPPRGTNHRVPSRRQGNEAIHRTPPSTPIIRNEPNAQPITPQVKERSHRPPLRSRHQAPIGTNPFLWYNLTPTLHNGTNPMITTSLLLSARNEPILIVKNRTYGSAILQYLHHPPLPPSSKAGTNPFLWKARIFHAVHANAPYGTRGTNPLVTISSPLCTGNEAMHLFSLPPCFNRRL